MRKDWHGLMKVLEIQHLDKDGKVIWENKNLYNILHSDGEEFLLKLLFDNASLSIPQTYYLGLDDRATIAVADTIDDVTDEPASNGYLRQSLSSDGDWSIQLNSSVHRALSKIVTFSASGGTWGPASNMFLTNESDDSGVLIATVPLSQSITLSSGESVNMRIALSLRDFS